jgi:hypothetical protein
LRNPLLPRFDRKPTIRPAMFGSRRTIALVVLALLALSLRLGVVVALWSDHAAPVSYEHGHIAENLLNGQGFSIEFLGAPSAPTSQQAPFYPFFLAGIYACFGVETSTSILAVQLIQCLAGTALVLAIVWLAWSLIPESPAIGWLAGVGAAVYPTHLYMVTHLQVALWAAMGLTLFLAVVAAPRFRCTWRGAILAGLLAGLLLLIEPILALVLPIGALAFLLNDWRYARPHHDSPPRSALEGTFARRVGLPLARVATMATVAAIVIAPWVARNWHVHGRFVFIKSTFGYAFWQGNNPSSWGTDKIPKASAEVLRRTHDGTLAGMDRAMWEARHETVYIDDVLLRPNGYRELAGLSETQRCGVLGRKAVQFIRENPGRYGQLCLNRLRYFLLFDETNPKAANRLYRLATVVWLVLAFIGLLVSLRHWRRLWPTYAVFTVVTLFHVLVITSVRFRIPIEPLSFVWAASALAPLAVHLAPRQHLRVYRPGERSSESASTEHGLQGPHWGRRAA